MNNLGYDIPPQLQHKEKIVGPLTFEQCGYAAISVLIAVAILKFSPFPLEPSFALSSIPLLIGTGFVFFDLKKWIRNFAIFLKFKSARMTSVKMKKFLSLKKIENDILHTTKGKVAVLEATPINFMIKSEEEQEAIVSGFQQFLNSLSFPVQIHISSMPINLKQHFKKVRKQSNGTLAENYCKFLQDTINDKTVLNRKFLVLVKERNDIEMQTNLCQERLDSLGLQARRMKTKELVKFIDIYLNKQYKRAVTTNEGDEILKLLAPENIVDGMDAIQVNDLFYKTLAVTGYPHVVNAGFLNRIISMGDRFDISIHIHPYPISHTMIQLNKDLQKQLSDLYAESKKGIVNPTLEIKSTSTRRVLEDLQKGKQKLFDISLYVMCRSRPYKTYKVKLDEKEKKRKDGELNKEYEERLLELIDHKKKEEARKEVDLLARKVKAELAALMIESAPAYVRMRDGLQSMLPLAIDSLQTRKNITTSGLGACFPFSSPYLVNEPSGILLGLNRNNIPYIKDIFKLSNANGVVLATSGAGKSYFTKLLLSRLFMGGTDIFIIDPQGEYMPITRRYGGQVITISKDSETIINPLDLMGHEYIEKRLSLMDVFKIMFGELTEVQKAIMDKAIDLTYDKKGIRRNSYENKVPPKLEDLYRTLKAMSLKATTQERMTYTALLNRLGMYTSRGVFNFLNQDTNIDFTSNFVCFNIGSMPKKVKPVVMYLVLDYIYMRMKKSLKRKILVIDEAWSILQTAEESSYIFEIVKTCRKFNLGLLMITQDVADLVNSKAGHAVLANSAYTFLLRQKPAVINSVAKTFNLSSTERDHLMAAQKGKGILILDNDHQELEVIAAPEEHELITTNADELIGQQKKVTQKGTKVKVGIDQTIPVHKDVSMSMETKNFLINQGFKRCIFVDIGKTKSEAFYVKPLSPESVEHVFMCERLMLKLEEYGFTDMKRHLTVEPDVIAAINGETFAFEVETGKDVKKKRLQIKYEPLMEKWGDRLIILVVDSNKKYCFEKYSSHVYTRNSILQFLEHRGDRVKK